MNPLSPTSYPIHVVGMRGGGGKVAEAGGGEAWRKRVSGASGGGALVAGWFPGWLAPPSTPGSSPPRAVMALTELQYDYRSRKVT